MAALKLTRKQIIHYAIQYARMELKKQCESIEAEKNRVQNKIGGIIKKQVERVRSKQMNGHEVGEEAVKRVICKHFGQEAADSFRVIFNHYTHSDQKYAIELRCNHTLVEGTLGIKTDKTPTQQKLEARLQELDLELRHLYNKSHRINEDTLIEVQLLEDQELVEALKLLGSKAVEVATG